MLSSFCKSAIIAGIKVSILNEELNRYEAKIKYERDLRYWTECYAEMKYNEAREKGAQQKAIETAKKFLAMGLSVEQVADGTGLSIDEIEKL